MEIQYYIWLGTPNLVRTGKIVQMIQNKNLVPIYTGKYFPPTCQTISVHATFRNETCVAGTMVTVIQVVQVIQVTPVLKCYKTCDTLQATFRNKTCANIPANS